LSRKHAIVIATIARQIGIRIGPRIPSNDLPWSTWALRSNIASQIHIAGSTCTRVRRQLDNSSRSPPNSSMNAPTATASGASARCERLRRRIAASIFASSFS
jgi:hypothetical protein